MEEEVNSMGEEGGQENIEIGFASRASGGRIIFREGSSLAFGEATKCGPRKRGAV